MRQRGPAEALTPGELMRRTAQPPGGNTPWASDYGRELVGAIRRQADRAPRNRQAWLGPSEIGEPCTRQVVAKFAGEPKTNHIGDAWPAIIGTSVHAWLAQALEGENRLDQFLRWITEARVVPHPAHPGHSDFYDTARKTVGDWKGTWISTPVPTPAGWTTAGAIQPGDLVFGSDGTPCTVTRTYPVQYRDCYRITFNDGSQLITDDVQELPFVISGKRPRPALMSVREAAGKVWSRRPQRQLRLYNGGALELPPQDLVVHPYVLGCWLGDGGVHGGTVNKPDDELFEHIRSCGYSVSAAYGQRKMARTVYGLSGQLQVLGLQWRDEEHPTSHGRLAGIKRIPPEYLRGSYEQRLSLLQGLCDTDGTWNKPRKRAVFNTTDKGLAEAAAELITTLGWKAHIDVHQSTGFGLTVTEYYVEFTPQGANPFRLSRKADLVRLAGTTQARYRIIRSIEPVLSVPTRCIDVDSPDHLYLAGEQMVPVHNCLGKTAIEKIVRNGPGRRYFVQLLLYALGFRNAGLPVERVALVCLPRTEPTLDGIYVWEHWLTPADDVLLAEVFAQTEYRWRLAQGVLSRQLRIEDVERMPSSDNCRFCFHYRPDSARPGAPETVSGCPGMAGEH
jgi:hypothetical protein